MNNWIFITACTFLIDVNTHLERLAEISQTSQCDNNSMVIAILSKSRIQKETVSTKATLPKSRYEIRLYPAANEGLSDHRTVQGDAGQPERFLSTLLTRQPGTGKRSGRNQPESSNKGHF